eukprot:CAMPEP_0197592316 /NCGR_PEP_ID=MMETSP1326-20131121/15028_1 /TAXON_ID=1155430 /ORGANISM="Genus nov. species nov., Strain RCC2288" /LENGTH=181 /DNA_ID=CAMNT_0043158003 /DNA_START=123 /DNA_END=665 /DNA_ORIENTATION=-
MSGEAAAAGDGGGAVKPVFAAPAQPQRTSLLGLDKLAKEKRDEKEAARGGGGKRGRAITSMLFDDQERQQQDDEGGKHASAGDGSGDGGGIGPASKRAFRGQRTETPSHPGGVNEDVRRNIDDRRRDYRDKDTRGGVSARSADDNRGGGDNRDNRGDNRGDDRRDDRRDDGYNRGGWGSRG